MPVAGVVNIKTLHRDLVVRFQTIVTTQLSNSMVMVVGSRDPPKITRKHNQQEVTPPLPDPLPFKYIVVGSSINPGPGVRYDTDTLLTDADVDRMRLQENLKVNIDKVPWAW